MRGWGRSRRGPTSASTSRTCAWRRWRRSRAAPTGMRLFDRLVQHQLAHEAHRRGAVGQHLVVVGLEVELVAQLRSEEHTSELQSLMRISYAVFCLKKKKNSET